MPKPKVLDFPRLHRVIRGKPARRCSPAVLIYKYYLKHEQECFFGYITRGKDERFISDKAQTASVLDGFKSDPFYIHVISLFTKKFSK